MKPDLYSHLVDGMLTPGSVERIIADMTRKMAEKLSRMRFMHGETGVTVNYVVRFGEPPQPDEPLVVVVDSAG